MTVEDVLFECAGKYDVAEVYHDGSLLPDWEYNDYVESYEIITPSQFRCRFCKPTAYVGLDWRILVIEV